MNELDLQLVAQQLSMQESVKDVCLFMVYEDKSESYSDAIHITFDNGDVQEMIVKTYSKGEYVNTYGEDIIDIQVFEKGQDVTAKHIVTEEKQGEEVQ